MGLPFSPFEGIVKDLLLSVGTGPDVQAKDCLAALVGRDNLDDVSKVGAAYFMGVLTQSCIEEMRAEAEAEQERKDEEELRKQLREIKRGGM